MPSWLKITEVAQIEKLDDLLKSVTITKEVLVEIDSAAVDPDEVDEDKLIVKPGRYAIDSLGRVWQYIPDISGLFAAFGVDDPRLRTERGQARMRQRESKRKPKREPA